MIRIHQLMIGLKSSQNNSSTPTLPDKTGVTNHITAITENPVTSVVTSPFLYNSIRLQTLVNHQRKANYGADYGADY